MSNDYIIKTPGELSDELLQISYKASKYGEELGTILKDKAKIWLVIRAMPNIKSDKTADRHWDNTERGSREIDLRYKIKALEFRISAIKTKISVLNSEAHNQY